MTGFLILSTFHQKWLIPQCWWGDPLYFLGMWQRSLTLFYNFFCMIYCKCDILLPAWICVCLHQTFSIVYYSALLLFFCRNQLLLFLPWIYRQHLLLCIFKLASCISHHNNRLLRNHIHSLYVSDMLQCMTHYCLLSGANVWIFSVIISKSV